jgi:redox-sensitive bicupin YhaK (pirin superfamily)
MKVVEGEDSVRAYVGFVAIARAAERSAELHRQRSPSTTWTVICGAQKRQQLLRDETQSVRGMRVRLEDARKARLRPRIHSCLVATSNHGLARLLP